ncbi:LLM class flavin-dependent oxidoreductase [Amycolatopsis sp. FBCC-B4732]|uniref:LLM class flavin-dependent oxidoreductase n=1 Tax=Amycolatopsis sp. FBCC-B4732 TaxID=3079339 RepID=UPI001FF3360A|nr:LLM class flavin-dependent oxidoreductase [Amycolatopsis sp. FBCC-B4732]UOX90023.1 LLM class flavin-dependent oxidoreductase [Amycolatopsis sp. FBCC-B4732]
MRKFEIEVNINPSSMDQAISIARTAELMGADQIGVWDSPALYLDPWVALGVLSREVTTTPIGVCVTNPTTRHLVVTANAVASLSHATEAGVYLGVGTGDSGVYNLGGRACTLADLRIFVVAVKELLGSGRTKVAGKAYHTSIRPRGSVPVYLAAHGRRSLELGAELADGLLLGLGHSPDVVEPVLNIIADVRGRFGGGPEDLQLTWNSGGIHIDEDSAAAARKAEWLVASFAHHFSRFSLHGKFVPEKYHAGIRALGEAYDLGTHGSMTAQQAAGYRELASRLGVRDYLLERFVIAGTRSDVAARVETLAKQGVRRFSASVAAADEIVPALELAGDLSV